MGIGVLTGGRDVPGLAARPTTAVNTGHVVAGSLEFPFVGAHEVTIRGTTGSLIPIGDPGQIAISWESDGCRHTIWVNDLSVDEAADYAGRF